MNGIRWVAATIAAFVLIGSGVASGAELSSGAILGTVRTTDGSPIASAAIDASSASGRYAVASDAHGAFVVLGVVPDTYTVTVRAPTYASARIDGVVVLPGARERLVITLRPAIKQIANVTSRSTGFSIGSPTDTYTVNGAAATAGTPSETSSGLANYSRDTVQGAIAQVPGVQFDSFANAIVRGGKVSDTVYDFDSVPVPQGLIAEPGGNIVGAQLGTAGVGETTVTLGGYSDVSQNALGGVVNEVPAIGTFPARGEFEIGGGIGAFLNEVQWSERWATPDLRWRYALASTIANEYFSYGDGHTFYPAEIGTYGLGFQTRAQYALSGTVHYAATPHDDLSATFLGGAAAYQQYDSPYGGLRWCTFDSPSCPGSPGGVTFPGQPSNPNVQVTTPSIARGSYDVEKLQWIHNWQHSLGRLQVFRSNVAALANGPEWDDLSFPDGVISLYSTQTQVESGFGYDFDDQAGERHDFRAGGQFTSINGQLYQLVPTIPQMVTSGPALADELLYAGDTWTISPHLTGMATLRYSAQQTDGGAGLTYGNAALDPHASLVYRFAGNNALRATFDRTSVMPLAFEVQRTCTPASACGTANAPLAPETANDYALTYQHSGRANVQLTYFTDAEQNRIDVLPVNVRSNNGQTPNAIGIPSNVGRLQSHGLELSYRRAGWALDANYNHTLTSSIYQFAFNDLNAAAIAAGHLFPAAYIPDFTATLSYEITAGRGKHLRVSPLLSYESGYPYGNGTMVWIFNHTTGQPEQVPNDNYVNPGYNYYFLRNPSLPYNRTSNPYIASIGTPEGSDPNTLRTTPQLLVSLHAEADLSSRLTAIADVVNLFANASPTQLQGNPYLIGPPGYTGGNPYYEAAYGANYCQTCSYTLGNGVPTNDGAHPAVPWNYGRGAYVPQSYPLARTLQLRLRYRI